MKWNEWNKMKWYEWNEMKWYELDEWNEINVINKAFFYNSNLGNLGMLGFLCQPDFI